MDSWLGHKDENSQSITTGWHDVFTQADEQPMYTCCFQPSVNVDNHTSISKVFPSSSASSKGLFVAALTSFLFPFCSILSSQLTRSQVASGATIKSKVGTIIALYKIEIAAKISSSPFKTVMSDQQRDETVLRNTCANGIPVNKSTT